MSRVLTALILVPFALFTIFRGADWFFFGVVAAMATLCYSEFIRLARGHGVEGPLWAGFAAGMAVLFYPDAFRLVAVGVLAIGLSLRTLAQVVPFTAAVVLGVLYTFAAWRCAVDLRAVSPFWVMFALAINWAGDVAAYYVGRAIGKHKLAPLISPGKSWEGAAGSVLAAVLFGLVFQRYSGLSMPLPGIVGLSILANIAGQLGDLAESAMKRGAGLKDSGTLLPGHGGFLDRMDSSLFTLPVVYYVVRWSALWQP